MDIKVDPITSIEEARVLVLVGDSVTTDHISPAGAIPPESPAGLFLQERGVSPRDFNSYGSRRGNDQVMTRGTFANIRLRNLLAPGTEGGWTTHLPSGEVVPIFEASRRYQKSSIPTIVLGGKDYGMGSSRDWAAKGTLLLGSKAVIAESFERIHRSNLVGMGVLPLQFAAGENVAALGLTGKESYTIHLDEDELKPGMLIKVDLTDANGETRQLHVRSRIDTPIEVEYYRHGGILAYVLRNLVG
jgi:aconitate hydratase